MEKLGLNLGYLLIYTFAFGIMFVVLNVWVYKPLMNMLDKRRQKLAQGLEDARVAEEARSNAEKEAEKILNEAQAKASEVMKEATEKAQLAVRDLRASAEAEAAKARETAINEAQIERDRILGELRGQVAALAISAAQKLLGESLDEKRQHALLNEFFSGVKSGKLIVLEGQDVLSGSAAEITSALPLTDDEKAIVRKDVLGKLGDAASISFRVDPVILGGVVLRVGDRVVDASVAGQLEGLRQKLQ